MRLVIPFGIALAATAVLGWHEMAETHSLDAQLPALRSVNAQLAAARAEQKRLLAQLPPDSELHALRVSLARTPPPTHPTGSAPGLATSPVGEWSPVASWRDRGCATPRATLETTLWAAAGGDAARFAQLLQLSDEVRARADAIIARLPADAREKFSTAEALIAAFTIKSIPIGPAEVVWAQESDPDHATLAVFVRNPAVAQPAPVVDPGSATPPAEAPTLTREQAVAAALEAAKRRAEARPPGYIQPPQTPPRTTLAYLSMHHGIDGWRLDVPLSAIDKIARELTGPVQR